MESERAEEVLIRLGLVGNYGDVGELRALVEYVLELGASVEEVVTAARLEALGPLALDYSVRPAGPSLPLDDFAVATGLDPAFGHRLWLALGLPEHPPVPFPVTPDLGEALGVLALLVGPFGEDAVLGFARTIGSAAERIADALASATRVGVEVPERGGGKPYRRDVDECIKAGAGLPYNIAPKCGKGVSACVARRNAGGRAFQWN